MLISLQTASKHRVTDLLPVGSEWHTRGLSASQLPATVRIAG
jgi:hypothetical protein